MYHTTRVVMSLDSCSIMSKAGCGNFVFPAVPDVTTQNRERDLYFQFQFPTAHFHHYFAISPDLSSFNTQSMEGKG